MIEAPRDILSLFIAGTLAALAATAW